MLIANTLLYSSQGNIDDRFIKEYQSSVAANMGCQIHL